MTLPASPTNTDTSLETDESYDAVRADDSIQYDVQYNETRANDTIQYEPVEQEPPAETPQWLQDLGEFLSGLFRPIGELFGASWPVVKWVLLAAAVAMLLYILWRLLAPVLDLKPKSADIEPEEWTPAEEDALALLSDADRLAAEGQYDAATHLLLQRSVGQIAEARPEWVEPSSTARELATLSALPDRARTAFSTIAERVERSVFALRKLGVDDWEAARAAYADFALQRLTSGGGNEPAEANG